MALRGRKPKPAHLKLVEGNPGKRAMPDSAAAETPKRDALATCPKYLKRKDQRDLWAWLVETCWWLGDADAHTMARYCALEAEWRRGPEKMIPGRIAQLRALANELGLDPSSRSRLGAMKGRRKPDDEAPERPKHAFFDD